MAKQTFTTGQVLTAAQMTSLQQTAMGGGSTTAKTTSYTLVAADAGTVVQMNSASATTITVNTALFAAGDTVQIQNVGAGVCTVTAGTATVSTSSTLALKQYDAGSLYFNTTSAAIFFAVDAADSTSPLTTKGDLYGFSTLDARIPIGTNNQVLTADSAQALGLKWATPSSSKVVQITQGTYSTGVGTSSTTFVDTGLTATITPTSASNKVLAFVNLNGVALSTANAGHWAEFQLNIRAGAATSSIGARIGINGSLNASQWGAWGISTVYLDSPSSTSACVYKVQYLVSNAASQAIIGSGSPLQTITLMEVTP